MLPTERSGEQGPLLVLLHWLGGGAQTWREVTAGLAQRGIRSAALDLPGFGNATGIAGYDVASMAESAAETIQSIRATLPPDTPWLLAGHSMGGKVSAVLARLAEDGDPRLTNLRGLVLVSPSPPGPEPMPGTKRQEAIDLLGESSDDPAKDRKRAAKFVDDNTGKLPLLEPVRDRAINGVASMNRTALRHWMNRGSKEDWSTRVGTLSLPAILFAGTEDGALGPDAQEKQTLPHLPKAQLISLEAISHLSPLECPGLLVEHITQFLATLHIPLPTPRATPDQPFQSLLASNRVSPITREVMQTRLATSQTWNATPQTLTPDEFGTLRAVVDRVVPDAGFDLAALIDAQLTKGQDDGWRIDTLPPDAEAWRLGILSLDLAADRAHSVPFLALHPHQQDELLHQATDGKLGPGLLGKLNLGRAAQAYPADRMQSWFEDARAVITRLYIADPRTMDRIHFTGFADDLGFTKIELDQKEDFER